MRTLLMTTASLAFAAALCAPAGAQPMHHKSANHPAIVAGAAAGVGTGLALSHGIHAAHWGMHAGHAAHAGHFAHFGGLGSSAAGAAVGGFIAGVGTVALIDAATQPCKGFAALFGLNKDHCVNGQYVEYVPLRR